MASLTVSVLADRAGVRPDTIRYYERAGLLPQPPRSPAGYRQYDEAMVDRAQFIKGAQRLGLRLREIAELLEINDHGQCPCGHTEDLVRRRVVELDAEIARLLDTRQRLVKLADDCPAASCREQDWPCAEQFIRAGKEVINHGPGLPVPTDPGVPLPLLTPQRG
jgi:DNA-binding transcriptional MerR regulator